MDGSRDVYVDLRQNEPVADGPVGASSSAITDYVRTENVATGEVVARWSEQKVRYVQKMFVSRTDNVIVLSLGSSSPGAVFCNLRMEPFDSDLMAASIAYAKGLITCHNTYRKGKGGLDGVVRVINHGGTQVCTGDAIKISSADEVVLLMRLAPWKTPLQKELSEAWAYSPENPDFADARLGIYQPAPPLADSSVVAYCTAEAAESLLPKVCSAISSLQPDYAALFDPHSVAHGALFNRVKLDLGGGAERTKTTEELLELAKKDNVLPAALMEKMYDAGRYMFICSSGEMLPNLQGIWTGSWDAPWSSDYTLDTNVQAAMASACSANLTDLMEGYFRTIKTFIQSGG